MVYRLSTARGVTISQPLPRAAALQDSDLYVEVDKLDSYTHILPELTRMFAQGAVAPHLAQFLIALTLTMVGFVPRSLPLRQLITKKKCWAFCTFAIVGGAHWEMHTGNCMVVTLLSSFSAMILPVQKTRHCGLECW